MRPYIHWNNSKIGSTPPIRTKSGWLEVIHGVSGGRYSIGAVLLDLDDPTKIIGKAKSPILIPSEPYELVGTALNTVFTCGAIDDEEKDELRVYYGAADTCIGLATGKMSEIINMCVNGL